MRYTFHLLLLTVLSGWLVAVALSHPDALDASGNPASPPATAQTGGQR
jgi:hypothetical protein